LWELLRQEIVSGLADGVGPGVADINRVNLKCRFCDLDQYRITHTVPPCQPSYRFLNGRGKNKKRVIELEKLPDSPSPPFPSSPEPENDEEQTTFREKLTGTQTEIGTHTASPPNSLEINGGGDGDNGDAEFPSFSDSRNGEEEPDYGEI